MACKARTVTTGTMPKNCCICIKADIVSTGLEKSKLRKARDNLTAPLAMFKGPFKTVGVTQAAELSIIAFETHTAKAPPVS